MRYLDTMQERKMGENAGKYEGRGLTPEFNGKGPRWKELSRLARMMREEPAVESPDDLTARIMARVLAYRPSPWEILGDALLKPRKISFNPLNALRSPVSGKECSFYFLVVGAFYAILGMILAIGLKELEVSLVAAGWVRWQPQIAIATAGCMAAIGFCLFRNGRMALRVARIGTLVYLGVALLNGVVVSLEWSIPLSAFVSMLSALIGLPTGLFLIRTLQNCRECHA